MGTRKSSYNLGQTKFTTGLTRLQANRFLNALSFGAATARTDMNASTKLAIVPLAGEEDDATKLMRIGPEAYVTEQLSDNSIPSLFDEEIAGSFKSIGGGSVINEFFQQFFWGQLMHGSAQLRLKAAYALSQIFVINSRANSTEIAFNNKYYDNLVKATLSTNTSSFRTLLSDVAFSLPMAKMLTYMNNKKANPATFSKPDQNFLRELLQLMCPGLYHQNLDGTYVLDSNGVKIQTFAPSEVEVLAGIITGMGSNTLGGVGLTGIPGQKIYENAEDSENAAISLPALLDGTITTIPSKLANACRLNFEPPANGYVISSVTANTFKITGLNPSRSNRTPRPFSYRLTNDFTTNANRVDASVTLALNGTVATVTKTAHGLTDGTAIYSKGNVREAMDILLDWCFNHPSTAPFFAKSMIKFFVTSNPTPEYVKRVALKFIDNGNGVRGDISAVLKAIMIDREAIIDYGVNPNNHGRYLTVPEKIGRVARAFRKDNIHVHNVESKFLAGSAGTVFTKPLSLKDYAACGVYTTGSFMPYESGSIFNFFLPDFKLAGEKLGELNKLSPEAQLEVVGTKITWMNMVSQLCDTKMPTAADSYSVGQALPTNFYLLKNPTGNRTIEGFDFVPHPDGYLVTAVSGQNITLSYIRSSTTTSARQVAFRAKRRSDGAVFGTPIGNMPVGTAGAAEVATYFLSNGVNNYQVGDVLDVTPLIIHGYSGFPNRMLIDTGGQVSNTEWHAYNIMFHSVAALTPDFSGIPTALELAPAIDYLESILMSRPISAEIRALMVQIAQVPRTPIAPYIDGDSAFLNNWRHVVMSRAQQRARAMVTVLLCSPEFSSLR